MFGIGTGELLLILLIALLVLGPERMPKVARDVGKVMGELRRTSDELREEFLNADRAINKALDVADDHPAASAPAAPGGASGSADGTSADPNESPFDREMREARERLKAQQNH